MDIPGINPVQNSVPPKVTPNIPPVATPPNNLSSTIRIKPMVPPVSAAPVETPKTPTTAPTAPTIRLKRATPPGVVDAKRATSRVPVPTQASADASPVTPVPNTVVAPLSQTAGISLEKKSKTAPIPASKTMTSRITLDAVIGDASTPLASSTSAEATPSGEKTIKLKRPEHKVVASTSGPGSAPGSVASDTEVTQKKTIKVKRPGASGITLKKPSATAPSESAPTPSADDIPVIKDLDDIGQIPEISGDTPVAAPVYGVKPVHVALNVTSMIAAVVAIIIGITAICCLGSQWFHEGETSPNTVHLSDGSGLPWAELGFQPDDRK